MYAANGTVIKTYGIKSLILDLGLRKAFQWTFVIADVRQPILGADFLTHFNLTVNLNLRKLMDQVTEINVLASVVGSNEKQIKQSIKM